MVIFKILNEKKHAFRYSSSLFSTRAKKVLKNSIHIVPGPKKFHKIILWYNDSGFNTFEKVKKTPT